MFKPDNTKNQTFSLHCYIKENFVINHYKHFAFVDRLLVGVRFTFAL